MKRLILLILIISGISGTARGSDNPFAISFFGFGISYTYNTQTWVEEDDNPNYFGDAATIDSFSSWFSSLGMDS